MKALIDGCLDTLVTLLFWLTPQETFSRQARKPTGPVGRFMMTRIFLRGNGPLNDFTRDNLDLQPTDRVLDIGFGPGKLAGEITDRVPEGSVDGIDFSEAMVKEASHTNRHRIAAGKMRLIHGDCHQMPYPDNTFDKICTVNTIYFWKPTLPAFREMYRVLKPGGRVSIGFKTGAQMEQLNLSANVFSYYTEEQVLELLGDAGFSQAAIRERKERPWNSLCAVAHKEGSNDDR